MIKLVQGFDVCSPLPIDGRILLSKKEMYEIDDNILPERYFAICKEDGRLYLYNKFNVITEETGKWRLADSTTDERITREVKTLNKRIDNEVNTLNSRVDDEVDVLNSKINYEVNTLNSKIDEEVEELVASQEEDYEILDSRISSEVATLNNTINTKEAALQAEDARLDTKIDNYKEDKQLVSETELTETLADYSLGDEAGTTVVLSMDTTDYVLKIQLLNRDGDEISSSEVDTPLEEFIIDADYDDETKTIILHLKNGHDVEIPIGSLISDLVDMTTFNAHVNNEDVDHQHINAADRARWNTTSREAILKYDLDDPDNPNSLPNQLVAGSNVGIDTTGDNKVRISAKDTIIGITSSTGSISITSTPTPGAPDGITYDLNTESSAPFWDGIQGDDPLENRSLKALINTINTNITNEISARESGDTALADDISDLSDTVSTLSDHVDSEISSLTTTLNDEVTTLTAKDTELEEALADEVARAIAREDAIEELIDNTYGEDIEALKERATALETAMSAETTRAETAEAGLQTSIEGEATTRQQADETLQDNIDAVGDSIAAIEEKIPSAASSSNQLADKEFVNSSIATSTAVFVGTFDSLAELEQQDADDNDYGFVVITDSAGNTVYKRYKYADGEWLFEYDLNNSSFTAEQWEAINSGVDSTFVDELESAEEKISILEVTKVDKDDSKSLVDNTEIARLATMATNSTKVAQSSTPGDGNILVTSRSNDSESTQTVNVYTHPTGSAESLGTSFRKFSTDATSHIKDVTSVTAKDITDLNPYEFGDGLSTSTSSGVVSVKTSPIIQVNVSSVGWQLDSSGFGYKATVTVEGLKSTSEPIIDINLANANSEANVKALINSWSNVYRAVTDTNSLTLYATNIPEVNLPINIKGY